MTRRRWSNDLTKGLYPPHIVLEFEVIDGAEKVIKSGKRDLTDIDYQSRSVNPREDYLRYEKDYLARLAALVDPRKLFAHNIV